MTVTKLGRCDSCRPGRDLEVRHTGYRWICRRCWCCLFGRDWEDSGDAQAALDAVRSSQGEDHELGVLCSGGCGRYVMPATADDVGQQQGPWYCDECFAARSPQSEDQQGFQVPVCATCGHPVGDHQSNRASFPHPVRHGLCRYHGCDCREFVENDG